MFITRVGIGIVKCKTGIILAFAKMIQEDFETKVRRLSMEQKNIGLQ
jgi:hypothetical protein